jgi:hypothetical protein
MNSKTTFPCRYCHQPYPNSSKRSRHEKIKHLGIKHKCPWCDKAYTRKERCKNHIKLSEKCAAQQLNFVNEFEDLCNSISDTDTEQRIPERDYTTPIKVVHNPTSNWDTKLTEEIIPPNEGTHQKIDSLIPLSLIKSELHSIHIYFTTTK